MTDARNCLVTLGEKNREFEAELRQADGGLKVKAQRSLMALLLIGQANKNMLYVSRVSPKV